MYRLLHMRIDVYHLLIQVRMLGHHNLRVPGCCDEDSVDTTADRRGEDIADLQSDEEGKRHHDRGIRSRRVVGRVRVDHVQIREQGARVRDKGRSHGKHRADEALVNQGVDAAVLDQTGEAD